MRRSLLVLYGTAVFIAIGLGVYLLIENHNRGVENADRIAREAEERQRLDDRAFRIVSVLCDSTKLWTPKQCDKIAAGVLQDPTIDFDKLEARNAKIVRATINRLFVGKPGERGEVGKGGTVGKPGRPGRPGKNGRNGAAGARGPAGARGSSGPRGIQGPGGSDGARGPQGPGGARGPAGPSGSAGPPGAQGPPGPVGPAGVPTPPESCTWTFITFNTPGGQKTGWVCIR